MPSRKSSSVSGKSGKRQSDVAQLSPEKPVEFTFTFTAPITPDSEGATPSPARSPSAIAPSTARSGAKKTKAGHVPRPPNPFILFRSDLISKEAKSIGAKDFRHISRIAGHLWRNLPVDEKKVFQDKAEQLKREHSARHPDYNFRPEKREKRKRRVYGNGPEHLSWCATVADYVGAGLKGKELKDAIEGLPAPSEERPTKRRRNPPKKNVKDVADIPLVYPSPSSSSTSLEDQSCIEPAFAEPLLPASPAMPQFIQHEEPQDMSYSPYDEVPYHEGQLFTTTMNPYPDYPIAHMPTYDAAGLYLGGPEFDDQVFESSYDATPSPWDVAGWSITY